MKKYVSLILVIFAFLPAYSQNSDKVIANILNEGINNNQVMSHVNILTNRFGGRLIGSAAYSDAMDWCEYMLKDMGLEVTREIVGEVPIGFNRGPWFGRMIGGSNMNLHFTTPSYTSGTIGVQRGHVVKEPKTLQELNKIKSTLKGAWVLISGESNGWPIDYSAKGDSTRAAIIHKNDNIRAISREKPLEDAPALFYKEMKEAGILGIIQSAKVPITTLYDRNNLMNMSFDSLPDLPDIKLDEDQYKEISHMVDRGEYFLLEFDIRNHFSMKPVAYDNLFAVIRGSEYPDEYVMVGGHLDSYDAATGGVDCCVGATVAIEVARLLSTAGAKPKRSIMICLWAAEEYGLWGSKYFVETHKEMMPKISNYFNRDGGPTVPIGATVSAAMYDDFVKISAPLQGIFPFNVKKSTRKPGPKPTTAGGSDHAYFAMNGVPTISFDQGEPTGSNFNYSEIWHTDRDLYNKMIPENQENTSTITAVIAYGLANLDHLLDRTDLYLDE